VARHHQHGSKDRGISDAAAAQLLFDHFRALGRVLFALKHA
jgi:hypothetical protein